MGPMTPKISKDLCGILAMPHAKIDEVLLEKTAAEQKTHLVNLVYHPYSVWMDKNGNRSIKEGRRSVPLTSLAVIPTLTWGASNIL